MGKRNVNVRGYKRRDGTPVKSHQRQIEDFRKKQEIEKSLERLQKKMVISQKRKELEKKLTPEQFDMVLTEDDWAIAHFGRSEPYPSYKEYLNNLNLQEVKARKRHERIKELEKKMTPEQLKKLKIHYGMGVSGEFGRAERISIKGEKDGKKKN